MRTCACVFVRGRQEDDVCVCMSRADKERECVGKAERERESVCVYVGNADKEREYGKGSHRERERVCEKGRQRERVCVRVYVGKQTKSECLFVKE